MMKYLVLSNDKIFYNKQKISSNSNDTVNILESIGKRFKIFLISRKSKNKYSFSKKIKNEISQINYQKIFNLKKEKKLKVFIISVTLRNFLNFIIIKIFFGKISGYLYLRSDGHKEYEKKIGFIGNLFYDFLFKFLKKDLKVISVSTKISHTSKKMIIFPSELDSTWFLRIKKKICTDNAKLLYVGRIKVEKGIFSLFELLNKFNLNYKLSVVGSNRNFRKNSKITYFKQVSKKKKIINFYDNHNIFILPSFTEGAPKVILESLARLRPVIVFNEIKHVKMNFKGIFICNRKSSSLEKKIRYILKNYKKIQRNMKQNVLPTKKKFQNELISILDEKIK